MKQLTKVLLMRILEQMEREPSKTNIVRIEGIDNPVIYSDVCEQLKYAAGNTFVAKLTYERFQQFERENREEWKQALVFLHQGENDSYSTALTEAYKAKSYVDFDGAITKWRNESAEYLAATPALVVLMGTEATDDKGSLEDSIYEISTKEMIAALKADYSAWFGDILAENNLDTEENRAALNTLYKTIFSSANVDVFTYSDFIDRLHDLSFGSMQELIAYICETLNTVWGIPSVIDGRSVPMVRSLKTGKPAKIIANAIRFIERADDIPTQSYEQKLHQKFQKYAEENEVDPGAGFPQETGLFVNYDEFETCVLDFMKGKDLDLNRSRLLAVDYAILDRIIGTKIQGADPKPKAPLVTGEPMEAYSRMFLLAANDFYAEYGICPDEIRVEIHKIILSNCTEDSKSDAYCNLCAFLGGILEFFRGAGIPSGAGELSFSYDCFGTPDPFDFEHFDAIPVACLKTAGKWGDPCKVILTLRLRGGGETHSYDFKWAFSPYAAWSNAFSYLDNVIDRAGEHVLLPTLVACENIQDYLACESEEEFYAQLSQLRDVVLYEEHRREVERYFGSSDAAAKFDSLCWNFKDFALQLSRRGFFHALAELQRVVAAYRDLMQYLHDHYADFTDVQREKIPLLLNCFMITSNQNVIGDCDMAEVLLPAYHPVLLEKIDAKLQFLRDGFAELMAQRATGAQSDQRLLAKLENLVQLSSITQGVDTIFKKAASFLTCKSMWEYYGVYYDAAVDTDLISGNSFGASIVTDDEDASAMLHVSPQSNIIVRNVMDYMRTFPARVDGLKIAFVAPTDMQHIVAAVHTIAKYLEDSAIVATIHLKLICLNSRKNSASYLRKWLDSYFDDERSVKVNTFLRYLSIDADSGVEELEGLLQHHDLCFVYNILSSVGVQFSPAVKEGGAADQAKFPMTLIPDTISATHGKSRKVNLSQSQFAAAQSQTQATHMVGYPDSIDRVYRAYRTLELSPIQERIIDTAHICCKWVVCIDQAIDRHMLETKNSKIIGFTTGEGRYGELNVTVSARKDLLRDIKHMLRKRITEKFANWDDARLQKAADYCVDGLSERMDGSRILKALNPYDYEIHSFLAYILTLQMLNMAAADDRYIVRSLISLDSYQHWFAEDGEKCKDNKRPDFMLIEIPNTPENLSPECLLHIEVKMIECKMGYRNGNQIAKAREQLEKGLRVMSGNWDPRNSGVMRRYWLNQLYRAIIFSPLNMENTAAGYHIIRDKIIGILDGRFEIDWTGDIFAFWLDENDDRLDEWEIVSSLPQELADQGIRLNSMACHTCGQLLIQKMLLPQEERSSTFQYNEVESEETGAEEAEEPAAGDSAAAVGSGETIPRTRDAYLPFLRFLADGQEHTRRDSLNWFKDEFNISVEDQRIKYPSNNHAKWETVLDFAITDFRKNGLLENSELARFHLTAFGAQLLDKINHEGPPQAFLSFVEAQRAVQMGQVEVEPEGSTERPGVESAPLAPADETPAGAPDAASTLEERQGLGAVRLLLGEETRTKEKYYWEFGNRELNNRHLLINGNSGCGKTYCIQGLLMEAALQGVSSVVFDYTGGFTNSKLDPVFKEALGDRIRQRIIRIEKIPINPFAKHEIQIDAELFVPENDVDIASKLAEIFSSVYALGDQQKSAVYSAVLAGVKAHGEAMNFQLMVEELERMGTSYAKTVVSKIQAFTDIDPFAVDEGFRWEDIRDSQGMVYVMQLTGYGRDIQILLTELMLWDIWSYSIKNGDESKPFILVLDEAQNLSHSDRSPSAKILTEGRKFGLSGWYATQFMKPQLSDDEIQRLQQAGQKLYFCPPDDGVTMVAKNIDINAQGAKEWAERLKKLKKGECVTCGSMVRGGKWVKYDPKVIKISSMEERLP
ncbi:winged helix-turn-helix domain-containing protein [Ligaoa zhengdingensis]|uniref:winged helix-turn-helix domain-containing protein n=2 Tax=Ligaoa zhengdingensis TaxID=2763658 RepID=UPI0031BB1CB2